MGLLKKLDIGLLPLEVFYEISRITCNVAYEIVPLRLRNGKVQILLTRRAADDPFWPNLLHSTGTIMRASDDFKSAKERLLADELPGIKYKGEPVFVYNSAGTTARGSCVAIFHYLETISSPVGEWYDIDNLPDDVIKSQIDGWQRIAKKFEKDVIMKS